MKRTARLGNSPKNRCAQPIPTPALQPGPARSALRALWILVTSVILLGLPLPAQPDELLQCLRPEGYVTDQASVFSAAEHNALEALLGQLETRTTAQVAVVVLQSLEGGEIRDSANRLFERWGIGQKGKDNGVLILTAIQGDCCRKRWPQVGYGLEPIILARTVHSPG